MRAFLIGKPPRGASEFPNGPIIDRNWYESAWYCNWLSYADGIPEEEWCYEPNAKGNYGPGMRVVENCQEKKGYRLPTAAEWEFAARAGMTTARFYGVGIQLHEKLLLECSQRRRASTRNWRVKAK